MKIYRSDFNFEYQEFELTEEQILESGLVQIKGNKLQKLISNKRVYGCYPMGYKFVSEIYSNGKTIGINNVGTLDQGKWSINLENNTLSIDWKNSWINTTTKAYQINNNLVFFDLFEGNWRTSFTKIIDLQNHS